MTPEEFQERVLEALQSESEESLTAVVNAFKTQETNTPDELENRALILIGMYGCSGRTSRYGWHVGRLLEKGLRPNLVACAYLGLLEEARRELERTTEVVNSPDDSGIYPLHAAAERGDLSMVRWLCDQGANPRRRSAKGELAVSLALHAGPWKAARAYDVAEYLAPKCGLASELWYLAASGKAMQLRNELQRNASRIDLPDESGETPLFHASHNNHPATVQVLLEAGATPTAEMLATACMHRLSGECDIAIIEALLDAGVERTIEAATILNDVNFVRTRLQAMADAVRDAAVETALRYAVHCKVPSVLETLVQLGAKPDEATWAHIERIFSADERFIETLRSLAPPDAKP